MRVLIPGGTGLIGHALASRLLASGDTVIVLSRNPGRARPMPAGTELHPWDGRTSRGWAPLVEEADAVVNLVGEISPRADGHPRAKNASWKAGPLAELP